MGWWDSFNNVNPFAMSNSERAEAATKAGAPKKSAVSAPRSSAIPAPSPGSAPVAPGSAPIDYSSTRVAVTGAGEDRAALLGLTPVEANATLYQRLSLKGPGAMFFGDNAAARIPITISQYLDAFYTKSNPEVQRVQQALYKSGFYGSVKPGRIAWGRVDDSTREALKGALVTAARSAVDGKTTIDDVLDGSFAPGGEGADSLAGPRTKSEVVYSTKGVAQNRLHSAMSDLLGRRPTKGEVAKFHKLLNAAEEKHPVVTTTQYDADGTPMDATQKGGFGEADELSAAQDDVFANHGKEYAGVATDALTGAFERLIFGS